jgi:hypothetical protein
MSGGPPPLIVAWREALMATPELTPTDLAVGHALASFMNGKGFCWPAVPTVAEKAHCNPKTARGSLRKLERLGLLETKAGGGRNRPNHYRLNPGATPAFSERNPGADDLNPGVTPAEGVQEGANPPSIPPKGGRKRRRGARRGARPSNPSNLAGAHVKPDGSPDLEYLAADTA